MGKYKGGFLNELWEKPKDRYGSFGEGDKGTVLCPDPEASDRLYEGCP